MKLLSLVTILFIFQTSFSQDIDTSFVIKTPNSTINVSCKKVYENGELKTSNTFINAIVKINIETIDEATTMGVNRDKYSANLLYDAECNLKSMITFKPSSILSFNRSIEEYFDEFITAYNSNDLKFLFMKELEAECGIEKLTFKFMLLE